MATLQDNEPIVVLSYRRSSGELSTGYITLIDSAAEGWVQEDFQDIEYKRMLSLFARVLRENPGTKAGIQRIDRAGLSTMVLSDEETELFRKDPAAAIQARTVPPQVVHIGVDKSASVNMAVPFTVGYDMRADFFGEVVFVKGRKHPNEHLLECPYCGYWAKANHVLSIFTCANCSSHTEAVDKQEKWVGVSVEQLLLNGTVKEQGFFLPRAWNKNGNWISEKELRDMYSNYLKEKETVK